MEPPNSGLSPVICAVACCISYFHPLGLTAWRRIMHANTARPMRSDGCRRMSCLHDGTDCLGGARPAVSEGSSGPGRTADSGPGHGLTSSPDGRVTDLHGATPEERPRAASHCPSERRAAEMAVRPGSAPARTDNVSWGTASWRRTGCGAATAPRGCEGDGPAGQQTMPGSGRRPSESGDGAANWSRPTRNERAADRRQRRVLRTLTPGTGICRLPAAHSYRIQHGWLVNDPPP